MLGLTDIGYVACTGCTEHCRCSFLLPPHFIQCALSHAYQSEACKSNRKISRSCVLGKYSSLKSEGDRSLSCEPQILQQALYSWSKLLAQSRSTSCTVDDSRISQLRVNFQHVNPISVSHVVPQLGHRRVQVTTRKNHWSRRWPHPKPLTTKQRILSKRSNLGQLIQISDRSDSSLTVLTYLFQNQTHVRQRR